MANHDRRGTPRVQLQAAVNLKVAGQVFAADADLRDISLDGISIRTEAPVAVNSICEVEIILSGPSSILQLTGKGRIMRQDTRGVAIKFTELDMDSYLHLKNIVIYNCTPEGA